MSAATLVTIDLGSPHYLISPTDRKNLGIGRDGTADEAHVVRNATKCLIVTTIQCAFPQGMDRVDGRMWAGWQEALDEDDADTLEMPRAQLDWFRKVLAGDALKLPAGLAAWREALIDYLDSVATTE